MSVIQKDQNGVDHEILTLKEWEAKQGTTAQSAQDFSGYLGYSTGALVEAGQDPDEAYRTVSQNLFGTAVKRGFVQPPAQDDPEAESKLNESFRTFADQVTNNSLQDYGVLADSLQSTDPESAVALQNYVERAKQAKSTNQSLVQTAEEEAAFNSIKEQYGTPDQIRDARIRAAKEKGLSYVEYVANDKGERGVWINPDPAVAKDFNSILDSYKRSDGLNSPATLKFAQTQVQKTPGRDTAPYEDNLHSTLQQWIIGSNERIGSQNPESAAAAREVQDTLNSAKEIQQEAFGQGAPISDVLKTETTKQVATGYSPGPMGYGGAPTYKVEKTGKIAEAKLNGLYDSLKQAYPNNEIFAQYTQQQFVNAAGDLVKQSLQVPVNNEDPTKNFVKLSNGTYAPLASTALLPKEKFAEAMDKLGLDDRAKAAAEITRKGYLAGDVDAVTQALEDFDGDKFNNYRIEWLSKQDPTKKPSQTQLVEDYMSEASSRKDWNVLAAKASGVLASIGKSFNPIVQAIGGGVSNAVGFENGKNFFLDWAVGDAEVEASRSKYANLYGSDLGTGYIFLSQAAPMIADIAISGGVSGLAKGIGRAALKDTLVAGAEAGATASMRNLIPTSVKDFAGNIGKNWIAKALSPETRALFGQSYVRNFADVGTAAVKADSALVNKVFRGIKDDLANRVIPQAAGKAAQRASSFARSAESQYVDTTIAMRSEFNPDGSRKFTDEEIHKAALTHSLVAGSITALAEQAFGKVFGVGADAVNYGHANLRQLKYYTNRVSSALERSSLGGEEVLGAIKSVIREAAKESGYGIVKQGTGELAEEFTDQLGQSVAQAMLTNKDLNFVDALKNAVQAGVIGFGYGTGVSALGNARKVNEIKDRQQGIAQSVEGEFLTNIIGKLEADGQSPETVAALKNRLQIANRNFQPVSERIPVRPASADIVAALDEAPEQPLNVGQKPTVLTPSGSVPTTLAAKKAAELGVSPEELNSIQGSGKANKQGQSTVTPNDVQAYVAQRANRVAQESDIDWNDQAQVEAYLTRNGVKFVSDGNEPTPTVDETRTFKDLNGQLVIINGTRGRIRVEAEGVLLDPETNEPPIEVTPNANMPAVEFEGFEGAVAEPSLVSPRRGVRRVALTVSDAGEIVYGKTRYSAPTTPSLVNVKLDANGDIDSMYVLVQNKNGKAVYAYVTGDNAQKLRQVYESRGQESADAFANAVANSKAVDVQRNQAAASAKQKQSNQRRKNKRAKNGAPVVSNQGQAAVESEANYALSRITDNTVNPKLVEELKAVAIQLGLDPEAFTTTEELFRIVGPELAAGLDLATFSEAQIVRAVQNVQQGRTNTLLDFLVQQDAMTPANRAIQANHFAKLRAKHRVQFAKHGIKEGAMDVKAVLQSIIRSSKSEQHRETAKFLLSVGVDQCPVYVYNAPNDVATTGSYLGSSKIVALNAASDNGGGIVDALLHELGHFGTTEILTNPKTEFEREVRARLLALRAETQARIEAKYGTAIPENLRYAVEGRMSENEAFDETYAVNEFVAHYFASQTFREQLDGLAENGQRSLFQKFVDIIGSWFSGKRLADPESRALAEAMLDLKKAVAEGNGLPARSVQQVLASKAAVAREDGFGPMYGVPNPHPRDSFKWINHQTDSLQDGIFSEDQLRNLITSGKFGAFTAENPDVTVPTEEENAAFNEQAKQWLEQRGYIADVVVGRYGNGENSFLVEGFTDQDAVDFANEFGQESMATDTGLFYQDGMYQPRNGENLDTPADEATDDNFFTNVRTTEGKVITVRVMYANNKVDSGLRPSKNVIAATGSDSQIVQQVQNQKEFATILSKDTTKPFVLDGNTLLVNEGLVNEVYGNYGFDEQTSLVERDLTVAVAHELAMQKVGYDTHVAFEDAGLNAAQVIESAAGNDLTASDLQDLLALGDQAKDYVAAAFAEIGKRNTGENERLAVAQNRLGDLYRYLRRNGDDIPQEAENFSDTLSDTDVAIAERLRPVVPTKFFSKAYSGFNAADLKPGQALGTRNPTGKSATESGIDPMSLISLDVMARDPKAYRTNALYLTEYPIVAREFPELAATVRKLRTKHEKTSGEIRVNADQIKRYKKILKDLLTVDKVKATDAQFEDALLLENGGLTGQAGKDFAKNQAALEKCLAKSTKLKALGTEQKSAMTKTLAGFASDPKHPIATLAPQIYDVVIQNTQSNLEALINLFPKNLRNVAKLWYDGANKIANEFGAQYAQDVEQASGVLAVFSPQKDWFMNIALAERTMKIWHDQVILGNPNGLVWSPEMTAQWLKRGGEPQITTEATDGTKPIYEKGKVKAVYDSNGEHVLDEQGNPMFTGWSNANAEAGRAKAREVLKNVEGRALKDLAIEDQARFIRMYSEVNDSPSFMKYAPDGTNTQEASRSETSGKEIKIGWGSYSTVQKAIRIMSSDKTTKLKVVSKELGNMHKVRSFYNNIVDPNNEDGHVTMDTHAVAALYWQALSGNSFEVSQNFGSSNVTNNSILGVNGMYAANAEAYRAAAQTFGLLPREIQSITWEAVRLLFPAKWKSNKKNVDAVRAVWAQYEQDKSFTIEDVRAAVFQLATGKDINEAYANTEDLAMSLGFPSWAQVELRKGEVGEVPLEQAAPTVQKSRASVTPQMDANYLAAVEAGDTATAQNMVDEAAKAAGYNRKGIRFGFYVDGVPLPPSTDSSFGYGYYVAEDAKMDISSGSVSVSPTPNKKALENLGLREDQVQFISGPVFVKAENPLPQNLTRSEKDFINAYIAYESAVNEAYTEIAGKAPLPDIPKYLKIEDLVRLRGGDALAASIYGAEHTKYSNAIAKLIRDKRLPYDSVRGIGGRTTSGNMSSELVVQSANQIKSAEIITRDNNGKVIPLSERFNQGTADIRRSRADVPTLYHQTDIDGLMMMLPQTYGNSPFGAPETYFSTNKDLALSQRKNAGVLLEFDNNFNTQVPRATKPGSAFVAASGGGEELIAYIQPSELKKHISAITLNKVQAPKGYIVAVKNWIKQLEAQGWTKTSNPEGGFTVRKPVDAQVQNAQATIRKQAAIKKIDADYLNAVYNGDEEAQQRMVDEAAKAVGAEPYYRGGESFVIADMRKPYIWMAKDRDYAKNYGAVKRYFALTNNTLDLTEFGTDQIFRMTRADIVKMFAVKGIDIKEEDIDIAKLGGGEPLFRALTMDKNKSIKNALTNAGYDSIRFYETRTLETPPAKEVIVVFNPNQIKSADPITRDNNGIVIPLSERFNQGTADIRRSRAAVTEEGILNRLRTPKVSVNPPNGQPLYVTGYHGGTFDGRTPMKASSEGVYGYGYYTTTDVTRAKDYAVAARKEMGQAEVTTFDLLLKKPLVVKVSNKARGPALVFEALGLSGEKAESKAEHLFEQYGNIGKHFKSLGEKQGYDGLVILNADGTIAESVAWTRDSLTVDDNAPTIQFSRAALAPTTEQESKAFASATKNKRSGELAVAAVRLAEGQIDNATFADLVEILDPWVVKGAQAIPPVEQVKQYIVDRRDGKVFSADEESKIAKVKEELDIPEGQVIDWRIDIKTYNRSLGAGEVTYAITAHPLNNVGKVIGYTNIARVKNGRVMTRVEKGNPMTIAQGNAKFPLATVQGEHVKIDRLPADINDPKVWAEIAYNPARSSEFVDVRTKLPVLTFDDAIMVGSRVFMKNPTYDSKPRYQQPRVNLAGELTGEIDMRFSRASVQADADYLEALDSGDTNTAQRIVNDAAVASGYSEQTYYRGQRKFLDRLVKPTRNQMPTYGKPRTVVNAVEDFINKFFPSKASRGTAWLTDSKYLANQYAVMGDYKLSAMPSDLAQRPDLITEGQYGRYSGGGVLQSAKIDLRNSLQVNGNGSVWTEVQFEGQKLTSDQIADIAKARGFDSVVIANVKDGFTGMAMNETATVVAVFEDTKIKSADAVTYDNNGKAVPISQRFDQAVPNIRYSKSAAPALFRGKEVQLTHWSKFDGLTETDPTMHGTGGIGSEKDRKRDYKKIYQPRTYFGYSSYVREHVIGPFRYQIKVAGDSLYDYEADPLDLYPSRDERVAAGYARFDDRAANTMYEKAIKDNGFAGFVCKSHTAGVLFGKHKLTKVPDSDRSLALSPKPKAPKPLLSRAVSAVTSPDIEAAYRVSLDDLAINEVTGEYNFGTKLTRLFRASGNLDPRMFEAKQYQERAMALANARVTGLTKTFLGALKKESNVDLDDVNVALGTTAPTVSAAYRDAARATRDAAIEAANVQYQETNKAYATYKKATAQARADYLVHQDVKRYQAEVTVLQADLANSSEKQTRTAAITAANAAYDLEIQAGRAKGVKAAMTAQQQALFRLEQTSPRVAEVVTEFRAAIDSLSQQLVESLGPNDPMRAVVTENLGVYLTRTYQIHHDEGYAQKIKEDPTFAQARQEARDFFEKAWVKRTFKTWRSNDLYAVFSDAEVQALVEAEAKAKSVGSIELDNFIEQHGNTPEIPGKITNKTDLSRFMEKGEVPRELVAILGEVQNPVENAVRTYSNLAKFVGAQRLLNEFTSIGVANGFLITADEKAKDPEKYRLYEPLLNSTKTLGGEPLSNFYAQPEVKEAFKLSFTSDFKAKQGDAVELIKKIDAELAAVVGKSLGMITLGSAGFYTRNLLGNVAFMVGNGFVASPANIADAFKGLNEIYGTNLWNRALQVMPAALRPDEKFSLSELGPLGSDLIALGIKDSMNAGVLRELLIGMRDNPENFVAKLEQTIRSKGKVASAAVTAVMAPVKAVNTVFDSFAGAAEAIDLVYKFAYYSHEVGVYTKANAHNTTKWTDTQIKQLAARTVRKTTQGNSENPALVKAFQKSKLLSTLFNSFFRFTTEAARIVFATGQLSFQEMNSGNPVLKTRGRLRLAGLTTSLALSAVPELVKLAGGFDDEKEQAIRNGLPAWAQNVNYYFTKDSKDPNKVKMWNLTYVLPFSIIMDPIARSLHLIANKRASEAPMVAIKAVAEAFLSPQIAVQAFAKVLNNVDDRGGKIYYENDSPATAALKIGKFLASTAYRLKTPQKFYEAFEAYTNGSVYDKDARLATATELVANEFSPFQTRRYDLTKLAHQAFAKAKRDLDDVSPERGKFLSYSTLGKQDIENTYRTLQDARVYAAQKLKKTIAGYESLGVPMPELKKQATDAGFSRDRVNQILNRNAVDRVVFPPDLFKDMLERGGEANGQARVDFLKQVIRDTPRSIPLNQ